MKHKKIILISFIILFGITILLVPTNYSSPNTRGDLIISYIQSCQVENAGFSETPNSNVPNLRSTYQAVKLLTLLGRSDLINKEKIAEWINSTQNIDGGFSNTVNGTSDMESTFYAVETLLILGYTPKNNISEWINSCWNSDYGFGMRPNTSSTIFSSYCALKSLYLLNKSLDVYNTSNWLINLQRDINDENKGAFSSNETNYNIISTYYALKALNLTNKISEINKSAAISWIYSCQNDNNYEITYYGIFRSEPKTLDYSVINCYFGVYSLDLLDINTVNLSDYIYSWILECQNIYNGGFSPDKSGDGTSLGTTYYAVNTLIKLKGTGFLSEQISTELPFNISIIIYFLIGIAVAIGVGIFIKKKYY